MSARRLIALFVTLALTLGATLFDRCLISCHDADQDAAAVPSCHHASSDAGSASMQALGGCSHDHDALLLAASDPVTTTSGTQALPFFVSGRVTLATPSDKSVVPTGTRSLSSPRRSSVAVPLRV